MTEEKKKLIELLGLEPQKCFPLPSGEICCNYVIRGLSVIRPRNGDWLVFWPKSKRKKKADEDKKEIPALTGISNDRKETN